MRGYRQFSFSISITLVKIYISRIITNRGKNTFELVGTALNRNLYTLYIHLFVMLQLYLFSLSSRPKVKDLALIFCCLNCLNVNCKNLVLPNKLTRLNSQHEKIKFLMVQVLAFHERGLLKDGAY